MSDEPGQDKKGRPVAYPSTIAAALEQRVTVGGYLPSSVGVAPQVVSFDIASTLQW